MTKRQKVFSALGRFLKDLFTKNIVLKVVALLFAIMLWGYVLSIENPEYTKRVRDVEISIVGEDSLNSRGLMLVTRDTGTTDVDILCKINKHSELDASRVTCTVDLSNRAISLDPDENSKIITLDVQANVASEYGTVQNIEVPSVELEVARLSSRNNVQVSVKYSGSLPEGFTVDVPTSLSLSMRGQKSMLDRIVRGEATVDLDSFPTADPDTLANTYDLVLPVRFYDSSNILLSNITTSDGEEFTVNVRVVIRAYKEVEIIPVVEMLEEGYTWNYVLSRSKVILYGDRSVLNDISSVRTTAVAATPEMRNTPVAVDLILPDGVETTAGFNKTITVTITVTELTDTKTFEVPITYKNIGGSLALAQDTPTTVRFTISGTRSTVQAFDVYGITAPVDLYGYAEGELTLPIRFNVSGGAGLTIEPETDTVTVRLETVSAEEHQE